MNFEEIILKDKTDYRQSMG